MSDYVKTAVETAMAIHREGTPGDVLLLLPGAACCRPLHAFYSLAGVCWQPAAATTAGCTTNDSKTPPLDSTAPDGNGAGHRECNVAVAMLNAEAAAQKATRRSGGSGGGLQLLPAALHAGMSAANQAAALHPTPRGCRKVIQTPPCGMLGSLFFLLQTCRGQKFADVRRQSIATIGQA